MSVRHTELRERWEADPDSLEDRELAFLAIHMIGEAMTKIDEFTTALTDLDKAVDDAAARVAAGPDLSTQLASVASIKAKVDGIDHAPAPVKSPALPLYTYSGDPAAPIDPSWTKTTETGSAGEALYTYSGDTPGGAPTGDGLNGIWHLFTGAVTPAPVA